jgi:hypothetical protein
MNFYFRRANSLEPRDQIEKLIETNMGLSSTEVN